jgi:ribulose-bisphosphate carboxylase large chain
MQQAEQCWRQSANPADFAKDHHEFARGFESFPSDTDHLYPGWRQRLSVAAT